MGRIVGSGPNGFHCLVGCSISPGSASNQLNNPWSLSFDSYGNMFITDGGNNRIQKFVLSTNSCGRSKRILFKRAMFAVSSTKKKIFVRISDFICKQKINEY
jgi:hypothetical protein